MKRYDGKANDTLYSRSTVSYSKVILNQYTRLIITGFVTIMNSLIAC